VLTSLEVDSCHTPVWFSLSYRYAKLIFEEILSLALMSESGHENCKQGIVTLDVKAT
jgi:hypothetical protein